MRLSCIAAVLLAFAALSNQATAQVSPMLTDDFETGAPGWTFDAVVAGTGCGWAADGTPASSFATYRCGAVFIPVPTLSVFAGASALNWNDGISIQFGAGTAVPFNNNALSPSVTLTTLVGVTLTFQDFYDMDSCLDEAPPSASFSNHDRFVDFVDSTLGTAYDSIQLAFSDFAPVSTDVVLCANMGVHHAHTIALDTLPGLAGATLPVTIQIRFRARMNGYYGDIGVGTDVEDETAGWFVDDFAVNCATADILAPTIPVQSTPAFGAIVASPVLFDWSDSFDSGPCGPGSVQYDLAVDDPVTGPNPDFAFLGLAASTSLQVIPAGVYNWSVRAYDLSGNTGGFSGLSPFTVFANTAPLAPDTLFVNTRGNGAQSGEGGTVDPLADDNPEFSAIYRDLNVIDSANAYRLQVSTDPTYTLVDFDSGVVNISLLSVDSRTANLSIGIALQKDTTYVWRIQFRDVGGLTGPFSSSQTFRVGDDFEFGIRNGSSHHGRRCWVATAAWGSPDAAPVQNLQAWRFGAVESLPAGRAASRAYHVVGATAAQSAGSCGIVRLATSGFGSTGCWIVAAAGMMLALFGMCRLTRLS